MGFSAHIPPPLSQGAGYGILCGLGAGYCFLMLLCTYWLKRFNREDNQRIETFAVAGRNIGTGLTTTAVLASWLWPNAILGSTVVSYNFGIAGAYWFGAGCIVQIAAFALFAIQSKRRTPTVVTVLQVVKARYGTVAHLVFTVLCLANNLIAYINVMIAASVAITSITGVHTIAVLWLLPLAVCAYTLVGGLKSTFLADYLHTVSLLIVVLYLVSKTLASDAVGSIRGLYDLVHEAAKINPAQGNRQGSYLTLTSPNGLKFGVLHMLGNFGLVLLDTSYWQKAYAAGPTHVVPGYLLAGLFYFAIPILMGGVIGLAAVGLSASQSPIWPVQRLLSTDEINNGMPLAYTAYAVAGKGGSFALLWLLYQAATSTTSAEFVASGSIISQDIVHAYFLPNASEKQIIWSTHIGVVGFALVATAVSIALWKIELNLNWLLYMLGIVTTPGMVPLILTVLWRGQSRLAAIVAPLAGLASGLTVWLVLSAYMSGTWSVTVATAGELEPCMYGTIVSAAVPSILSPTLSFLFPDKERFDWDSIAHIRLVGSDAQSDTTDEAPTPDESEQKYVKPTGSDRSLGYSEEVYAATEDHLSKRWAALLAGVAGAAIFLICWCLIPFALYGSRYIFSRPFYYGWTIVMAISVSVTLIYVVVAPPWEGRHLIRRITRGVLGRRISALTTTAGAVGYEANDKDAAVPSLDQHRDTLERTSSAVSSSHKRLGP